MPAERVHAIVRTLACVLATLAILSPGASAQAAMNASNDAMKAAPTAVRDVLANDTGSTFDNRIVSNTQPANGTATCSALGACFYKANAGFTGTDTFTYVTRDAAGSEDEATVTVTVNAATASGDVIARDDDLATIVNRAETVRPLENDSGEGITLMDYEQPKHGTVACDGAADCTYTPDAGYVGSDGFPYTIGRPGQQAARLGDGEGGGNGGAAESTAAVHILVAPADTGYRVGLGGSPDPVPQGGQASWSLGVFSVPEGISGQELRALSLPSATIDPPSGPHTVQSVKSAKGWTSSTGADGRINAAAGDDALLGESVNQTFPKPLPPIRQGTGGDGHVPIIVGSRVFAFYHHTDPTSATCVDRATGAICPGYPKPLDFGDGNGFGTTDINGPGVVSGSKIWTHLENSNGFAGSASIGLFCWDAATDSTCGLTIVDRVAGSEDPGASAPVLADGKMWFGGDTGKLYCVDPTNGGLCTALDSGLGTSPSIERYDSLTHGTRVYVSRREGSVTCLDVAAGAKCPGWETAKAFGGNWNIVNQHDATGATIGVCVFEEANGTCVTDAGATSTISNFVHDDQYAQDYGYSVTQEAEIGKRTLVASLARGGLGCYDWSTMAPCTGGDYGPDGWIDQESGGESLPSAYGATYDGSCVIALGDPGQVFTADPAGSSPCLSLGTGTDKLTVDLHDQRCDGTVGAARYRTVALSDTDASEMESVVVTVRDTVSGTVVSGELIGGQALDISGMDPSHPITVDATARSKEGSEAWDDGIPPRIKVSWKSDQQTACVVTKGDGACGNGNAALALVGTLKSPGGGSQEARLAMLRAACATSGGVKGAQARRCAGKRRFNINIRYKGADIRKLTVTVKGKKQKVLRMKPRPRVKVDLRKYARQRIAVKIAIVTKAGKTLRGTRVYHPCTKKRPGRGFRY